jgi:hypothetical protein
MRDWKTTFTAKFQVRTTADRAVCLQCCSAVAAEYVWTKGRSRHIWQWIDGRYVCLD